MLHLEGHITSVVFFPEIHNLNLIWKNIGKPKLKGIQQNI